MMTNEEIEKLTETYRDFIGVTGIIQGRGQEGFRQFDEWFAAVTGQKMSGEREEHG